MCFKKHNTENLKLTPKKETPTFEAYMIIDPASFSFLQ